MRALLDVNMLIALLDPDHLFHEKAHLWWREHQTEGWASCPVTENGLVRIVSLPKYSPDHPFTCMEVLDRLRAFTRQSDHIFLGESPSIRDEEMFRIGPHIRSAHLTDLYLLSLAVSHDLRLVTFDRGISLEAVCRAKPEHLVVLA